MIWEAMDWPVSIRHVRGPRTRDEEVNRTASSAPTKHPSQLERDHRAHAVAKERKWQLPRSRHHLGQERHQIRQLTKGRLTPPALASGKLDGTDLETR